MKYTILYYLTLIAAFTLFSDTLQAQGIGGVSIGDRFKNAARQQIQRGINEGKESINDEIRDKKGELKREVRAAKNDVKSGKYTSIPYGNREPGMEEVPATMDDIITDPGMKASIEDRDNKKRFVSLFGQWWSMPSDSDFDLKKYADSLRRARNNIDSSKYRVPKMVTKYQPVTIWGWHFAEGGNNNYKTYNYGVINTIAYSSYDINAYDGSATNKADLLPFISGDFTKTVRQDTNKPVVIFLTLSCHSAENVSQFLNQNLYAQQNLIDTVLMFLDTANANGVEIDFENIPYQHKDNFVKFVKILASSLRKANPNYAVCISVPSRDPLNVYDISLMRSFVDFFVIRAFDFHQVPEAQGDITVFKDVEGPASPLNYNAVSPEYDLRACIEHYIGQIGVINANRLIVGLPYFGTMWESQGNNSTYLGNMSYRQIKFEYVAKDIGKVDTVLDKYCFRWESVDSSAKPPIITSIYYDDVASLKAKYETILGYRLGGVAVYQLGNDAGFEELWSLLANEFTYVDIPPDKRLAQIEMASKKSRRYGTIALAVLLFLTIFMSCGFFKALLNTQTRQRLFENGKFRLWYLGFFTLVLLVLGGYLGLFEGKTSTLLLGVLGGAALGWIILKIVDKQQAKQP